MDISTFFLQRHAQLHKTFLPNLKQKLSEEALRTRPVPGMQPIAWLIWHMMKVEDLGLSRLVWDKPSLYNEEWHNQFNVEEKHYGTSMTDEETLRLAQNINIEALFEYQKLVGEQTEKEIHALDLKKLDEILEESTVRRVVTDEGMASENAQWVIPHYVGKTRGWALCHFGLTHNFRHFGQIALVRKLLGRK